MIQNLPITTDSKTDAQQQSKTAIATIYATTLFKQYAKVHQTSDLPSEKVLQMAAKDLYAYMDKQGLNSASKQRVRTAFLRMAKLYLDAAIIELEHFPISAVDMLRAVKRGLALSTKE